MNVIFYQLAKLLKHIPLNLFIQATQKQILHPFYHAVADHELLHIKHLYKVRTPKEFEKDLDFFIKYYKPIDYNAFKTHFDANSPIGSNRFLLSFDDGLREFHDIIAPILTRKGIPAVCFLNTAFIDNKALFFRYKASILIEKLERSNFTKVQSRQLEKWFTNYQLPFVSASLNKVSYAQQSGLDELAMLLEVDFTEYLQTEKPYLETQQIKSLQTQGFKFGAHSVDHPLFSALELDEQLEQIKQSVQHLAENFELNDKLFSFPFTDFGVGNQLFREIFDSTPPICEMTFGCAGLKNDSEHRNIQRIAIEREQFTAEQIVYAEYIYYLLKAVINKNCIKRF